MTPSSLVEVVFVVLTARFSVTFRSGHDKTRRAGDVDADAAVDAGADADGVADSDTDADAGVAWREADAGA